MPSPPNQKAVFIGLPDGTFIRRAPPVYSIVVERTKTVYVPSRREWHASKLDEWANNSQRNDHSTTAPQDVGNSNPGGQPRWRADDSLPITVNRTPYSPTTIEVLPPQGQNWKLGFYTSEALREKVLAQQGFDLSLISGLEASEARSMMILFDYVVSNYQWNSTLQRRLHRAMRCIAKTYGEQALPPAFFLQEVTADEPLAHIGGGGYADAYKGLYGERAVCLKVPRIFAETDAESQKKVLKAFLDEAIIWRQLHHPNILPFFGISQTALSGRTCFVSPFMIHGDLNKFLRKHPNHDRVSILYQVAQGLQYLHSVRVYHGDIKAANVVVDENYRCCLADFGLSALISTQSVTAGLASTTSLKGSYRWMAPEILNQTSGEILGCRTAPRDIYALACTAIEVATGRPPFPDLPDAPVIIAVVNGKRPTRPHLAKWMTDDLWNFIERCWAHDPNNRPSSKKVVLDLERVLLSRRSRGHDQQTSSGAFPKK